MTGFISKGSDKISNKTTEELAYVLGLSRVRTFSVGASRTRP